MAMVTTLQRPGERTGGATGLALGGMLALASAMGISRFAYTPILPFMVEGLGLSKSQAGLIAAANFLGYLLGALAAAAPRLPVRRHSAFLAALLLGAASCAGMALLPGMAGFLLLRLLAGIASAFAMVLGAALVLEGLAAAGRGGLAALHFAGVGLGIALSAVLVTVMAAAGADWRGLWLGMGAAAGLLGLLAARLVPEGAVAGRRAAEAPGSAAPGLGRLSLCHGLFGFGYSVTATFLVAVLRLSPEARALEPVAWLLVGLAAMPSTLGWSRAAARIGARRAYALACLVEAAGVAAGGIWAGPAGVLPAAVLLGGTFMGITALGFGLARELAPRDQRRAFALTTAGFGLGQILGPLAGGALLDATGSFAPPSLLAAGALVLAAGLVLRR